MWQLNGLDIYIKKIQIPKIDTETKIGLTTLIIMPVFSTGY